MNDHLRGAIEELKRVDHLIYVSLKYTRTVDVLSNVIQRMTTTCNAMIDALAQAAKEQGKVKSLPPVPVMKARKLREIHDEDEIIRKFLEFYTLIKAIKKSEHTNINEYRRHVTLIAQLDEGEYHINIDKVTEFYKDLKQYVDHIKTLC
jgi:hypothetical protein